MTRIGIIAAVAVFLTTARAAGKDSSPGLDESLTQSDRTFANGATGLQTRRGHGSKEPWLQAGPMSVTAPRSLRTSRAFVWGGITGAASVIAYRESQAAWGASNGKFHFKDDLRGDGLAMTDEASHLFAAYELARVLGTGYRWTGLNPETARCLAALHAWAGMFLIEYPIDAYNPSQGMGLSDLAFNTVGVLAAYHRQKPGRQSIWDFKISVKRSFFDGQSRVIAYSNAQYDDYIYWLTVRPTRIRHIPLLLGLGYSTEHGTYPELTKQVHFGIGTSLGELGPLFGERTARFLAPLDFFFLNVNVPLSWR